MSNVLITGAAGYLGTLVTQALAADRRGIHTIVATDIHDHAPRLVGLPGVEYRKLDVRDAAIVDVVEAHAIDIVVHLAAIVNPGPNSSAQLEYDVDVGGTRNVLDACVAHGVRKLIVTSSGAAYGYHADNAPLLTEDCPLRGNDEFPYARHKRLVEEMLARYRAEHPELGQLVFRPGTVLGASVSNQITAMFEKRFIIGVQGSATPFVFIWDQDVVACVVKGVHGDQTGVYNLAGDGVLTLREIAHRLGKRFIPIPVPVMTTALRVLSRFDLTRYGPEQVRFLQYRPVLGNERLKREFGYRPRKTSREVFDLYCEAHAS